jgi:transposase
MRFYTGHHRFYCGIDLHARSMYVCILNHDGAILVHKNLNATPENFLQIVSPYRDDLAVAVECIFSWYWLADLCTREKIPFVLGHALYMKAIHSGKSKNDKIDAHKIAMLLRAGMIPQAYVYPARMRATRDLLRRRMHLMRKRAELFAHIQNTTSQYNLPEFERVLAYRKNRDGVAEVFGDPTVRTSIQADPAHRSLRRSPQETGEAGGAHRLTGAVRDESVQRRAFNIFACGQDHVRQAGLRSRQPVRIDWTAGLLPLTCNDASKRVVRASPEPDD